MKTPDFWAQDNSLLGDLFLNKEKMIMNNTDNRYAIKENERKKILEDINIGIWRIELEQGQQPRLYGDMNMYAILGADLQMQPEQLYQHWHERIDPVYLSYVDKAVERLLATGQPAEVEYRWNHPQYGKTVVRCDATLSPSQENGKVVMLGLHRDITDKLVNDIREREGYHVVDYYKMSLCGKHLIRAYEDIFFVNMETKAIHPVAYRNDHCLAIEDGRSMFDVIAQCVLEEDQEKVCALFSDESMQKITAGRTPVSVDFRRGKKCKRVTWVRGSIYPISINGVEEFVFVVQNIQDEYGLKRMREEKEDVLYSIIHERSVIYEFDTELQQPHILKYDAGNILHSKYSERLLLPELAETLCVHYIDHAVWPEVKTFLSKETIDSSIEEQRKKFSSFPLNTVYSQYDYIKISIIPSLKSKTKAYLVLEEMDRKERLYPILEAYARDMADHFYCIDLKTGYFFRLIGTEGYGTPPEEGYNYTQEMLSYAERFVVEEDRELAKKQMSPEFILKALENKQECSFVESVIGEHGEIRRKLLTYRYFDSSRGYVLLQRTDVTDMYDKEELLRKAQMESMTDPLTKLYNRLGSERMIKKALSGIDESKNAVLIMLDLDNFKKVNDRFGHPVGDQILCEAAQKLKECFRAGDIIGRLGGDEYIIFLPEILHKADIHPVLNRVVNKLNIVCKKGRESIKLTVSVGATFYTGQSYEELYVEADAALYHAKKRRDTYALFEDIK